jgi:hypothetical protein
VAANTWALNNLQSFNPDMIGKFHLARDFAYSGDGLDLPRDYLNKPGFPDGLS